MKKYLRIGIYLRESTKEQAEKGYNLDGQDRRVLKHIKNNHDEGTYEIVYYIEDGYSSKTLNRPKFNIMMDDIKNNKLDIIYIHEISRLIRRLEHWYIIKHIFDEHNVLIQTVKGDIDTSTPEGRFKLNIDLAVLELEQDRIGTRTVEGLTEGAEQGFFIKGGKTSFGYKREYIKISENKQRPILKSVKEQVQVLRKMRDYLRSGYAPYTISILLRSDPYLIKKEKMFTENQITRMLTDKLYAGIMSFQGIDYVLDCEKIFTLEEIEEHKELISKRRKTSKYEYIFTNKVFSNTGCLSSKKSTVKENGPILYYFDIQSSNRINEKKILDVVLDYFASTGVIYKNKRNQKYTSEIRKLNHAKEELYILYKSNKIYFDNYLREIRKIDDKIEQVKKVYNKYVENIHAYFNSLSKREKMLLVDKNINRIEIDFITKQVVSIS